MAQIVDRRNFFKKSFFSGSVLLTSGVLLSACNSTESKKEAKQDDKQAKPSADPCNDFSGISDTDLKAREKLGYVKESPIADSKCSNCQLYLPQKDTPACGKCQLFKGPVLATGYCTYWAAQVAE
ncbi:hypothetical protein DYBT9275_00390 [Dyadobacter sp. CECT 9275]|uniref:High-potential iron-sulfur protein n=1 Tax=Dyadobacter helix TaxID=2822344 RepID=A0A916J8G9_9BACT|nr:high-potential iron-sulfur protein [Dyadobacter sp. CECT 9275]CAG4989829.1 hypothetical protein DYBT9275_00390 [Dyadobacter sp. CECT 9275]